MDFTLQEWSNLAEIVGSAAIIFSLIFVGIQISDSTKGMRAENAHSATVALQTWYNEVGTNEQAAKVFRKGMTDPSTLSKDEATQFLMCCHSALLAYQSIFFVGSKGTLDAALYKAMVSILETSTVAPGFHWYWQQRADHFTDAFRNYVDSIIISKPKDIPDIYK